MNYHTLELEIDGLACAACASRAEQVLRRVPGVLDASVDLAAKHAVVHASTTVMHTTLIEVIREAGFDARPCSDTF